MKLLIGVCCILVLTILNGCDIPTAKEPSQKRLIIVSDYLFAKDSILFNNFEKREKINVKIIHQSADDIKQTLRSNAYTSGYDLVMLNSMYHVNKFAKLNLFHPIESLPSIQSKQYYHTSDKYNYVGFALDPYTIAYDTDTTFRHRTYSDLKNHAFHTNLNDAQIIPMLASLMSKLNKVKAYKWTSEFQQKRNAKDSTLSNAFLSLHSELKKAKEGQPRFRKFSSEYFPNMSADGVFYNLKTFCFVAHAENIQSAQAFVNYYLLSNKNDELAKSLRMYPAATKFPGIRFYKKKTEKLLQYYGMTERILYRLNR